MRRILLILIGLLILSGCITDSSLSFSKVNKENLSKDVQSFLGDVKKKNGVHLYLDKENDVIFVYLNGSNVVEGQKAIYFIDFGVEGEGSTINLSYKSDETSDYINSYLEHELIYKVNLDKDYEEVKLFNNGSESSFLSISGNN